MMAITAAIDSSSAIDQASSLIIDGKGCAECIGMSRQVAVLRLRSPPETLCKPYGARRGVTDKRHPTPALPRIQRLRRSVKPVITSLVR